MNIQNRNIMYMYNSSISRLKGEKYLEEYWDSTGEHGDEIDEKERSWTEVVEFSGNVSISLN